MSANRAHRVLYDTSVQRPSIRSTLLAVTATFLVAACRERPLSLVDRLRASAGEGQRIALLEDSRAVTAPLSSELACDVDLSEEPFLKFSISVRAPGAMPRGEVRFSVLLESGGREYLVYRENARPRVQRRTKAREVNLAAWRNERVRLRFVSEPHGRGALDRASETLRVVWEDPVILNSTSPSPDGPPSIVLILVDTLRRDYLGFNGFRGPISPNLDWLARESVDLDNAFTQAPWTKPSIASLFTSLYPDVHRLNNHEGLFGKRTNDALNTGILPSEAVTMAEAFRDAGYRTAAFVANPWLDPRYGFDQGFDLYRIEEKTESVLENALRWMRDQAPGGEPFFLYLHFMDVHGPYDAPEEDFEKMKSSPSLDVRERPPGDAPSRLPPYLRNINWFANAELAGAGKRGWGRLVDFRLQRSRILRARYAANVRDFDRRVAPFLNELRSSEWNDRAIVVLTSDHGEELLEHGGWDHGFSLYDDQIRVPLLVRLPNARQAGRHVTQAVNLIDLMPTLLSAVGARIPSAAEGRDLSPLLFGGLSPDEAQAAPSFATISTATKHREGVYAVRTERYKLILDSQTGFASLFDLSADPGEYRDLSSTDETKVRELERLLSRHLLEARARALGRETAPIPDALQKRLESLGYLER